MSRHILARINRALSAVNNFAQKADKKIPNQTVNVLGLTLNVRDLGIIVLFAAYLAYSHWFKYNRWLAFNASFDYLAYLQMFWNTSHGRILEFNGLKNGTHMMFQFHFAPFLLLIVPFYMVYKHPLTPYFVHTVLMASSVIPLYLITKKLLNNRLAAYLICLTLLFYPPFINADLAGFAEEVFAIPLALFALYFLLTGKERLFIFFCALLLSLRINMVLVVSSLGILAFFTKRKMLGATAIIISGLWLSLIVFVIHPMFPTWGTLDTGKAQYVWGFFYHYGTTPKEIVFNMLTKPELVKQIVFTENKLIYFNDLFRPLLYLPLLSPFTYLAFPVYAVSLLSGVGFLSTVYMHYQAPTVPFIFLGFVTTIKFISEKSAALLKKTSAASTYISVLLSLIVLTTLLKYDLKAMPARLIPGTAYFNKIFFSPSSTDRENYKLAQNVPEIFRLATDEGFMEHIAERRFFYDTTSFEKLNTDLALFNSFGLPEKYKQAEASKSFTKIYSHYYTHLFARRNLTKEYEFNRLPNFRAEDFYIIRMFSNKASIDQNGTLQSDKSYTVFDKQGLIQKFPVLKDGLSKIRLVGNKEGRMKGNLVVEIRDGLNGKTLYKKLIPAGRLSYEREVIEIVPTNLGKGNYFLATYLDHQKSREADGYTIAVVPSEKGTAFQSWDGGKTYSEVPYAAAVKRYYNLNPEIRPAKNKVFLEDGSILISGNGAEVRKLVSEVKEDFGNNTFDTVIVVSKSNSV